MSEEEYEAIERIKKQLDTTYENRKNKLWYDIEIVLNLIEKQQNKIASREKQIKLMQSCDLAKVIKKQQKEIEELKNTETYKIAIIDKDNYISKNKIKEKIKKLNKNNGVAVDMHTGQIVKTEEDYKIEALQELLEGVI